jgi:hypothetical protein
MINQKGGLAQSAEDIKIKAKQDVAAPWDYTKMIVQLQAFVILIEILFGEESIVASKLKRFICLIKVNFMFYKRCVALDDFFSTKVLCQSLWSVCTHFQLFLVDCTQVEEREDVDNSLINFSADHRDIILDRFSATLLPCFKELKNNKVTNKDSDTEIEKRKKNKKQKKEETKQKMKERQAGDSDLGIKNKNQCVDFKVREGEWWSTFAGASLRDQAKLNGLPMCRGWHTRGFCFSDCKNKASHIPCLEIPADVKEAHILWMKKVCRKKKGFGLRPSSM